jgi:hypothetical protein
MRLGHVPGRRRPVGLRSERRDFKSIPAREPAGLEDGLAFVAAGGGVMTPAGQTVPLLEWRPRNFGRLRCVKGWQTVSSIQDKAALNAVGFELK